MTEPVDSPCRILIVDDHPIFRAGLRKLLEAEPGFAVVGEAHDGDEALELARTLGPDLMLLDLTMPRLPGLETLRALRDEPRKRPLKIIMLTAAIDRTQIVTALQLGASGVMLKDAATELLFKSIRTVMAGQCWVGREGMTDVVEALRSASIPRVEPPKQTFGLTKREFDVLRDLVSGSSNKEIAKNLSISEDTVKHHVTNIFDKLGLSNRLEVALYAVHHRLVETS